MNMQENVPLAPYTTFGIGGPARYLALAQDEKEVCAGFVFAKEKQLPVFILGGGSNVLMHDAGFNGLVIKIEIAGIEVEAGGNGAALLIAGAGESWDAFVARATAEGLFGVENLSGIPGTVGGAVFGNIGAYGQALSQTLAWVEVLDTTTGDVKKMTNTECLFGYRESFFTTHSGRYIILRAAFSLSYTPNLDISYKDLAECFKGTNPSLHDVRYAVLDIRRGKFPDLALEGTAGSFFKNPIVTKEAAEQLLVRFPGLPVFAMPETQGVKVPLAWLLDRILNLKGFSVGGARLFEKQPLVIAAKKGTPSEDVAALARAVAEKVKENFFISIEPEVKIIS